MGLLLFIVIGGCVALESPAERKAHADALATAAGWQPAYVAAGDFVLAAYEPSSAGAVDTLTVYIEGDGLAWLAPDRASPDPSPRDPVGLRLALRHPDSAAAWLGRPCQFVRSVDRSHCEVAYWTGRRFSEEVVAASAAAVSELMRRRHARHVVLVGYSGGGAIAALVAARRDDVQRLVTVAGNLDHREWTRLHRVDPLQGSLDAADFAPQLAALPQVHWVGGRDTVVERAVAEAFAARFPEGHRPSIREIADADHAHGWVERWPGLLIESGR
jgi:pimeloyl-ACP methyl ester carboxylesterase